MIPWPYRKRLVAGAVFGLYMAHLLYFVNPQVDITPWRLLTVTLVYGAICGLLFGSALWILRLLRIRIFKAHDTEAVRARGFGFVALAAFIAAAIYWLNLQVFRIYLPIDAVRVLGKATNIITAAAFVLLLLWVIERNADRRLSRTIFAAGVIVIALSSFFLYQRRESYRVEKRNVVVADIGAVAGHRPVILIAIRNLPYDWIVTMRGEGLLPFIDRSANNDFFTRLEPFETSSPKALWASLATGKLPSRHGVTGRFSYRTPLNFRDRDERFLLLPAGVGFRAWGLIPPVERISAQLPSGDALPIWALYERLHLPAQVITWPSTPRAQKFPGGKPDARIASALELDRAAMQRANRLPRADLRVIALEGFSETQRTLHIYENDLPAATTGKGAAMRSYARELDAILANIADANPDHLIVVCSPSAVVPPDLPANVYSMLVRGFRSDPGSDDGFLLLAGSGVVHRPNPSPAYVSDVVPTILFAAGLPIGRDMDGRILSDAFAEEFLRSTTLSAIQTYEADQVVVKRRG